MKDINLSQTDATDEAVQRTTCKEISTASHTISFIVSSVNNF
jgi:hypothetical protein